MAPNLGYSCEWLDASGVLARTQAVRPDGVLGAIWSPVEITVDPRVALAQIPRYLAERFGVQFRWNTAVHSMDLSKFEGAIVCAGHDFETLYPEMFRSSGVTRCKLQMMRTRPQPEGWQLGPALAAGLTLRFHESFQVCRTLLALKQRIAAEMPEYDRWGIHVLVSQTAGRELTRRPAGCFGICAKPGVCAGNGSTVSIPWMPGLTGRPGRRASRSTDLAGSAGLVTSANAAGSKRVWVAPWCWQASRCFRAGRPALLFIGQRRAPAAQGA